jgi:Asp-tRNA(Asn)/Glu-tRNA(Gln) amidotransferase A subunit family amidase
MDYNKKFTLHALADDLEKKVISSVELNKSLIKKVQEEDTTIGAFLSLDEEAILDTKRST